MLLCEMVYTQVYYLWLEWLWNPVGSIPEFMLLSNRTNLEYSKSCEMKYMGKGEWVVA